jgi:hypothetical protein
VKATQEKGSIRVIDVALDGKLWTKEELGAFTGKTVEAINGMMRRRAIPAEAIIHVGKAVRFLPSAIYSWLGLEKGGGDAA